LAAPERIRSLDDRKWIPVFAALMLAYLRLTGLKLGSVINFGEQSLKLDPKNGNAIAKLKQLHAP